MPGYDPKRAQELFNALKADGKPFNIKLVTYTNSDLKRLAAYVQQVLTGYENVTATIVEVDQANLIQRCKVQLDFDVCIEGGVLVSNGPEPNISNLLSSSGAFNWGQYKSTEMDDALAESNADMDADKIKSAYAKVQKLVATEMPLYIFGEQTRSLLLRNNTGGVVPSNGGILQKQFLYVCPDACVK